MILTAASVVAKAAPEPELRGLAEPRQHDAPDRIRQPQMPPSGRGVNTAGPACAVLPGKAGETARLAQVGYSISPKFRRIASISAHVGRPDSLPRYWIL
jgi:hypothetical protein